MANPFVEEGIIEIDSDDLIFGEHLMERNRITLQQIDAGIPMEQLNYFQEPKNRGQNISGEESTKIFVELYQKIKQTGFENEPYLNIEIKPLGQIRLRRGRHRLSILHHLGNRKIKVQIGIIDAEFKSICDKIFAMNKWRDGKLYNVIMNPLFRYIPVYGGQDRIEIFAKSYNLSGKRVLDVGSRMGYNSHVAALVNASVVGIDHVAGWQEIADYLTRMYERQWERKLDVQFMTGDIYEFAKSKRKYDVILFLSVFHHLVVADAERAYGLLNRLSQICEVMLFDAGSQWKQQFNIEHEGSEIIRRTEFKNWKLIGEKGEKDLRRNLWVIWK